MFLNFFCTSVGALCLPRILSTILPKLTVWTSLIVTKLETLTAFLQGGNFKEFIIFLLWIWKQIFVNFLSIKKWKKNPKTINEKKRNGPSEKLTKQMNQK